MKNTIVIDLDGTLANIDHRVHLVKQAKPDWDTFYSLCDKDKVNEWCATLMDELDSYYIFIVSGRRKSELYKTVNWLITNHINYDGLFLLRDEDDFTPDVELKKRWLYEVSNRKDSILFVIDDRQRVVDMWRKEGLVCLQCYAWEEFKRGKK